MIKQVYVWEFPVRLVHFFNFWCVGVLSATGLYIGFPFIYALKENELIMSHIRFVHFVAAYVFMANFFIRIYWLFVGNTYAHWRTMVPITKKQWKSIVDQVLFYLFLRKAPPHTVGHTGVAALSYLIIFILFFIEMLTGFALYSQSHTGFVRWLFGGWLLLLVNSGYVRLVHHMIMWLTFIFVGVHFYMGWYDDIREKSGAKSSIFSGYKSVNE
jgi:Ni/Fe-hydrogenase 1 B-type cytochrome subunit